MGYINSLHTSFTCEIKMKVIPIGTYVHVNNTKMRISDIMISGSCHRIVYHLTYWEDGEPKSCECDPDEITLDTEVAHKRIGFHHAPK